MRALIVATMRNEAPFILEWIAWHRVVGFDHFLIYSNDCSDGTDEILQRLDALGIITWVRNREPQGGKPQTVALDLAVQHPRYLAADWVLHIDADEYVLVRTGKRRLTDLFAAVGDANMVSASWRNFGNSGHLAYAPDLTTERFTWCAPRYIWRPWQIAAFKTFHKPLGHWERIGPHRPYRLVANPRDVVWVNGAGRPMPRAYLSSGWLSRPGFFGDSLVQINHYAVRSADSFLVKSHRGISQLTDAKVEYDYWCLRNFNFEQDLEAQTLVPEQKAALASLLSDAELAGLHTAARDRHRAYVADLKSQPVYRDMYDAIAGYTPTGSFQTFRDGARTVHDFTIPEVPHQDTCR